MVLSYFLTHFDSDSKSAFILIFAPLYVMPFFLLVAFERFDYDMSCCSFFLVSRVGVH